MRIDNSRPSSWRNLWRWSAAPLVLSLFTATGALSAQQESSTFAESIDVRVVNLEVIVTDKQGNRVRGLGPEQFRLEVDGQETEIGFFTEVRDGGAVARTGEGGPSEVGSVSGGEAVRTNYLVYVDDFFSTPEDRNLVLESLAEQLTNLAEGDRVAIVAFDGREIDLISHWVTDRRQIAQALRQAQGRKAYGRERQAELRINDLDRRQVRESEGALSPQLEPTDDELPDPSVDDTRLHPVELAYANRLTDQLERSIMAGVSTLRSFSGPPGRRVMLLLSGGWPYSVGEFVSNQVNAETLGAGARDSRFQGPAKLLEPLVDTANLLGYTLYPVDVPGLDPTLIGDAQDAGSLFERFGTFDKIGGAQPREIQSQASLYYLAERTGGVALINSERENALARVVEDTRTFYWLGFTPERLEDDREHEIVVKIVGRPDLIVRARDGFVDLSRSSEVTMIVESALLIGDPPSSQPLFLAFGKAERSRGKFVVPIELRFSMDDVTLIPQNGRWVNELELRVSVMDEAGKRSDTSIAKIAVDGPYEPQPGQTYTHRFSMLMRKKSHRVVIAIYDPISGAILSSSAEVEL